MPAYQAECQHDLFVSYAQVDDQAHEGEQGWVTTLVNDLKKRLTELLGRKDTFSLWKDEQALARNADLNVEIADAINNSACMLAVLSPGYFRSDWCQRERTQFLKWVRERDAAGGRVFVIERDWVKEGKPAEFQNLLGFKFWTGDPNDKSDLPRPLDKRRTSDRSNYDDQINRVAHAIMSELSRLKAATLKKDALVQEAATPTVFLAEVTDDLRPQWKKVHTELVQRGLRVVSAGVPRAADVIEKEVASALDKSQLFVQLLSHVVGQPLPGSKETYAVLQHRLALAANKRILQWRSPAVTEEFFDSQDVDDPDLTVTHRRLLFGQVRAEHLEDFKRRVIELALEPPPRAVQPKGLGMIYVSFNPNSDDSKFAEDLCGYLGEHGFGIVTPVEDDNEDPKVIRADFEKNVLGSRSWIVVYGDQKQKFWARGQVSEINQLLCEHKKQGGTIHLCAAPPPPKEVKNALKLIGIHLPYMKVIDCQSGFAVDRLHPFLDSVSSAAEKVADKVAENIEQQPLTPSSN